MSILLKILAVVLVAVGGYFGVQDTFGFANDPRPNTNPPSEVGIPYTNETLEIPDDEDASKFNTREWVYSFPFQSVVDAIVTGVGDVISWIAKGVNAGITWLVRLAFPNVVIPLYMGFIIVIMMTVIIAYRSWTSLWDKGHISGLVGLIAVFVIFIIAIIMTFLGLI